eukprot:3114-Heterococcus_DN1.PRE.7
MRWSYDVPNTQICQLENQQKETKTTLDDIKVQADHLAVARSKSFGGTVMLKLWHSTASEIKANGDMLSRYYKLCTDKSCAVLTESVCLLPATRACLCSRASALRPSQ